MQFHGTELAKVVLLTQLPPGNLTVNESVNWKKYDHFKLPNDMFINPFSRGILRNVLEFFHLTRTAELPYSKRSVLNKKLSELV